MRTYIKSCGENSIKETSSGAVKQTEGCLHLTVAVYGSCKKLRHRYLNGIVSVTSIDTVRLLDVVIMPNIVTYVQNKKIKIQS